MCSTVVIGDRVIWSLGELSAAFEVLPDDLFEPGPDGPGRPELAPWRSASTPNPSWCLCNVDAAAVLDRAGLKWHDDLGDLVVDEWPTTVTSRDRIAPRFSAASHRRIMEGTPPPMYRPSMPSTHSIQL